MKRTPWFHLQSHPPVRTGEYEWRCRAYPSIGVTRKHTKTLRGYTCAHCEWRGVLRESLGEQQ